MDRGDLQVLAWRLFEESNDAVFVLDPATETIQQANPAAQRLTGLRWRQLRGRCVLSKPFAPQELAATLAQRLPTVSLVVDDDRFCHSIQRVTDARKSVCLAPVGALP